MEDGFDVKDIDKLTEKLLRAAERTDPKQIRKFMKKEATKLKNKTKAKAKKTVKKSKKDKKVHYITSIKAGKVYKYKGDEMAIRVYSSAPHAHLIEYGHEQLTKDKKPTGKFVKGKRIFESTRKEFQNQFIDDIEEFAVKNLKL